MTLKHLTLPLVAALAVLSLAAQEMGRQYKVGDVQVYALEVSAKTSMGDLTQRSKMTQKVIKVYENGDADIENTTSDVVANFMGQDIPVNDSQLPKSTIRLNKFGGQVNAGNAGAAKSLNVSQYALLSMKGVDEMIVGKEFPINETTAEGTTKGTSKILSLQNGILKVATDVVTTSKSSPEPVRMKTLTTLLAEKMILQKVEGEIVGGLPAQAGLTIDELRFTMTLQK